MPQRRGKAPLGTSAGSAGANAAGRLPQAPLPLLPRGWRRWLQMGLAAVLRRARGMLFCAMRTLAGLQALVSCESPTHLLHVLDASYCRCHCD
mmetsp:Transcript_39974/g.123277  ORF Transcript_39974/g.123277 Transcript_39974/m.123277 type:complete len:93 (-) Transcript_39974:5-283(-)